MKKISLLILCFAFASCFKEPKNDHQENTTSTSTFINEPVREETDTIGTIKKDSDVKDEIKTSEQNFEITVNEINNLIQNKCLAQKAVFSIIDKSKKIILYGDFKFYLDDVYAYYLNENHNDGYGENHISIECYNKNSCIEQVSTLSENVAITEPFKTKSDCQKFIELLNELKNNLE